jgi:hypothetical protein
MREGVAQGGSSSKAFEKNSGSPRQPLWATDHCHFNSAAPEPRQRQRCLFRPREGDPGCICPVWERAGAGALDIQNLARTLARIR